MAHTSHDSAHSEILIRRSNLTGRPVEEGTGYSLLRVGEMAYSNLPDPDDDGFGNGGDRLYIGVGTNNILTNQIDGNGDSYNRIFSSVIATIGGKYFTDMMNHQRGIVNPASALLVDDNKKLNELLVDYLYFDKDSVSTEETNDLTLRGGTGQINLIGSILVTGNSQLDYNLNVDGITSLDSTTIDGTLYVTDSTTIDRRLTVGENLIVNNRLTVGDSATIGKDLVVNGISYLDSTTIDGDLFVTGNFTVDGTQTIINSTILTVDDKRIVIADGVLDSASANNSGIGVGDSTNEIAYINYKYNSGDARWEFRPKIYAQNVEFEVIDCGVYA